MPSELTCFLIDDDADDQEIFCLALKQADPTFVCITADSGFDALAKLNKDKSFVPDFIFLDLNMPRMNGKEFLKEIKRIPYLKHVPVIIFSTSSYQADIDETKALGAADFLTKPPSIDTLSRKLQTVFTKLTSKSL